MKKPILVLAGLLMFAGIASASVESDTMKIRYDKCVQQLAALDSVTYKKPDPNDPAFAPGNPGNKTYASSLANYNNQVKYREDKRAECRSLSGSTQVTASLSAIKGLATDNTSSGQYQFIPDKQEAVDPIATHPVIMHIEKTINQFWILFGLIVFLLLVIAWKVFRNDK